MADLLPTQEGLEDQLFQGAMETPAETAPAEPAPTEPAAAEPPPAAVTEPVTAPVMPPVEHIPPWRLREESEARRVAEERNRQLEERLNQIATHLKQNEKPPNFFEDPNKVTQEMIQRSLQPVVEEQRRSMMYLSKMVASQAHGGDKVETAEQAFLEGMKAGSLDPADYERVVTSPNRYDAVVQWHKRQTVLTSVGDDPNAWFEKQLEAKMADPTFQAKMLEKVRGGAATRPGATTLPPSLSRVTAAAANGNGKLTQADMSDENLFSFAMAPEPPRRTR
jgi:hypothetical protein